jgi:hypothetical protein
MIKAKTVEEFEKTLEDLFKENGWEVLEDWDNFEVEDLIRIEEGDYYENA